MVVPAWGGIILGIAAVIGAVGIIFSKVVKPIWKFARKAERMIPILQELTSTISDPSVFEVINNIAMQFRTDSGSSLRDVVDRLERASITNATFADTLRVGIETTKQLAEIDRKAVERLVVLLDRLTFHVDTGQKGLEEGQKRIEEAAKVVAADLVSSQERADAAGEDPGESADAAAKSPKEDPE